MTFLNTFTILCIGLLIGTEFSVSAFVNPILWKLEARAQAAAISLFARTLGTVMPFWYSLSLLLLIIEAAVRHHQSGELLLLTAIAIWVAVILLTILFLIPINNRMTRLNSDSFTEEARKAHKQWDTLHRVRIAALCAAMICFLLAIQV